MLKKINFVKYYLLLQSYIPDICNPDKNSYHEETNKIVPSHMLLELLKQSA